MIDLGIFVNMNWTAMFIFLLVGLVGLWVSYSFLNKRGLYLFSILAVLIVGSANAVGMFSLSISINTVILPLVYLALLTMYVEHGKKEATDLFVTIVIAMAVKFVFVFFQAAYIEAGGLLGIKILNWTTLASYLLPIVSFCASSYLGYVLLDKEIIDTKNKFLSSFLILVCVSLADNLIFTLFGYIGALSFGNIILTLLTRMVLCSLVCLLISYLKKFLNRKLEVKVKEEPKAEETTEAESNDGKELDGEDKKADKKADEKEENINYDNL